MKRFLLSAFDPFGGEQFNATQLLFEKLKANKRVVDLCEMIELPTSYNRSVEILLGRIAAWRPEYVICFGESAGRNVINVEKVAINLVDTSFPDNDGVILENRPVWEGGENALFATLPVKELVEVAKANGIPAVVSYSAGTYVCNYLMYSVLQATVNTSTKVGFVHLPIAPQSAAVKNNWPSMDPAITARAVECWLNMLTP